MANTCAVCGESINVFQAQKLADGNYLCRKNCCKKAMKNFDLVHTTLDDYKLHTEQVERGTKLWDHFFVPRLSTKDKSQKLKTKFSPVYIAEDIGLFALTQTKYKFFIFGKTVTACVFRLDDLVCFETETETNAVNGSEQKEYFVHFAFRNTEGMSDFRVKYDTAGTCRSVGEYFNTLFGIQKTLGNSMNNWRRQKDAIKNITSAVSAAARGDANAEKMGETAFDSLDAAIYGDRSELKARADKALGEFNGGQ